MSNLINADLDEIVFRPRNKSYGAYQLRKRYSRTTLTAFLIGTGVLILMIVIPSLADFIKGLQPEKEVQVEEVVAELTEPPPINEEEELPEEIEYTPPPPPKRAEVKFVPPEVVEHEEAPPEETIMEVEELDTIKADIGDETVEGDMDAPISIEEVPEGTGTVPVEIAKPEPEPEPDPFEFVAVEQQPDPVNLSDIRSRIKYPPILRDAGIEGTVFIKILVDKQGKPVKHLVVKSPHELLEEACVKEIYNLNFTPGIQAGKPIKVWVAIPFKFTLNK